MSKQIKRKMPARIRRALRPIASAINYYRTSPNHKQLRMQITKIEDLPDKTPLPGYSTRTYRKGDDASWINILQEAFGEKLMEPPEKILNEILKKPDFDPESFLLAIFEDEPVGTVVALTVPVGETKVGYINLLSVVPTHQGKRLGKVLTLEALRYFKRKGLESVLLDTDDFRLGAIKTYLDLGFKPVYINREHKKRWAAILKELQSSKRE